MEGNPELIITKATVSPDFKATVGGASHGEDQIVIGSMPFVDWTFEAASVREMLDQLVNDERTILFETFRGHTFDGDPLSYCVERMPDRRVFCAHIPPSEVVVRAVDSIHVISHEVSLVPVFGKPGFFAGVCHEKKAIYLIERQLSCYVVRTGLSEPILERLAEAVRVLNDLPIPEEDRIVWPVFPLAEQERQRNMFLNGLYREMVDRIGESLPQPSKPPISSPICSSCKAENLENFLRAGGKVYCHQCVEKFPACCFCGQKVPWEGSYTSKRDENRIACPPCLEERKGRKLVKEVSE